MKHLIILICSLLLFSSYQKEQCTDNDVFTVED